MIPRFQATDTSNVYLLEKIKFSGAPGEQKPVSPNRPVSMILCSVKQGGVDIYFGGPPNGALTPDLHFGQTNKPEWVPIPCGQYDFVCVALGPANPVLACVWFGGPP